MKILILGKDGQVGRALVAATAGRPEVMALGRAEADFGVPNRIAAVLNEQRPDVIINAVAYTAVDKAESDEDAARRVNADAVFELAFTAGQMGATVIHYSTDYVFDGSKPEPYVETDQTRPLNVYGKTKRGGEMVLEGFCPNHLVFRTSWVHARGGNNFIAKMLSLAQSRDSLSVIDDQVGAPTGARLIAEVSLRVVDALAAGTPIEPGIYHLTASGETTWNGYARFVIGEALAAGLPLKVTPEQVAPVPTSAFPSPAQRPLNSRLSTEKLRSELGIELPDWRDEVRYTLAALLPEATN